MPRVSARCRLSNRKRNNGGGRNLSGVKRQRSVSEQTHLIQPLLIEALSPAGDRADSIRWSVLDVVAAPQMRAVPGAGARHVHAAAAMHDAASNKQKRGRDDAVPGAFERARAHFQEVRAPGEAVKAPSRMAQLTPHLHSCRRSSSKSPSMQSRDAEAAHGMRTRCVRFSSAAGLNLQQSPPGRFASMASAITRS